MSSVAFTLQNVKPAFATCSASALRARIESSLGEHLSSTLLLRERAAPLTVTTGIASLDAFIGGLPRGALSEIVGPASSGRTGVMLAALAAATRRQEVCALVDARDSFDPASAAAASVDLDRLLWVRCNESLCAPKRKSASVKPGSSTKANFVFGGALEQVLKVTDLLLQGGGFGMVVLDLSDVPVESTRRVPLTSWFRFRRAVEPTATVLLLIEQQSCAKTCASLVLRLQPEAIFASDSSTSFIAPAQHELKFASHRAKPGRHAPMLPSSISQQTFFNQERTGETGSLVEDCLLSIPKNNVVSHAALLRGMRFRAEVVHSWAQRKPPQSASINFELRTAL